MYKCKNAVAMIIFNRPENSDKVFGQVKNVKPPRLYIIADGARDEQEWEKVKRSREIADKVDWDCEVCTIFAEKNLGCKKRIITGISEVFKREERAIILEDDCVPTEEFFVFQDWALEKYESTEQIAVVSGSNLLDYQFTEKYKNGFSSYINCWGWGTWKRVWNQYDEFLSIQEINKAYSEVVRNANLTAGQKKYWLHIFRNSVYSRTIWDFYLQYFFFKYSWCSVYPACNLVENIGFGNDSTHMKTEPEYIKRSMPEKEKIQAMFKLPEQEFDREHLNRERDKQVLVTLYGYSFFSRCKIYVGNILRFLGIRK